MGYPLLVILHIYFWFKLVVVIYKEVRPPTELVLFLFILFCQLDLALISSAGGNFPSVFESKAPIILQIILLSFQVLLFSVILVQNNRGRRGTLIGFALLGSVIFYFLHKDAVVTTYFFQLILLIMLLSKTSWLVELTKFECWIYWLLTLSLFIWFIDKSPLQGELPVDLRQAVIWQKIPHYLFLLFRMYLLAMLIKIPAALVYHHARLSRKLWISSLFQSTFPQFIQFAMLVITFYLFISGWQAENLRQAIFDRLAEMEKGDVPSELTHYRFEVSEIDGSLLAQPYQPIPFDNQLQLPTIVEAVRNDDASGEGKVDHFIVFGNLDTLANMIHLVRVDRALLREISEYLPLLAGSQILAYPFKTSNRAEDLLYQASSTGNLGPMSRVFPFTLLPTSENNIQIFPFAFKPHRTQSLNFYELDISKEEPRTLRLQVGGHYIGEGRITAGRVFMPIRSGEESDAGYFAFDILLVPNLSFAGSPIWRLLGFLAIVYLLVNLLVTRRMIKFGEKINNQVVQKFEQLMKGIREISTGNLDYKVKLHGEDEFVELGERFNQMGDRLQQTITESVEKERLEHELSMARQVQLSLLPPELPDVPGYQIAATLKTATEVGGDFYDVLPLGKNKFLFTIGDVSGKGSSAALYMAQCISLIRFAHQFTDDPTEITLRLNNYFSDPMVDRRIFVTAIIGVLDAKKNRLTFARAGHAHPFLLSGKGGKGPQEVTSTGLGIGIVRGGSIFENKLEAVEVRFRPDDVLVFYSDGVTEAARSVDNEEYVEMEHYGIERLEAVLAEMRGKSAQEILSELEKDIQAFYQGKPMVDDYTLLVVRKGRG